MPRLTVLDEVAWEGREIPGDRTAALLRALVDAGPTGLSEDELVDQVWGEGAPANPRKALQVVVSRARAATAAKAIARTRRGYRLGLAPSEVDAWALRPDGLRLAALLRALAAVRGVPAALDRYEAYRARLANVLGVDCRPNCRPCTWSCSPPTARCATACATTPTAWWGARRT